MVALLAESFNPHVRYGACLAVGIACAGTAKNEALQLLEPMLDDPVDYVCQGALIATAMVMMQESEGKNNKVKAIRAKIYTLMTEKNKSTMTKVYYEIIVNKKHIQTILKLQCRWVLLWLRVF